MLLMYVGHWVWGESWHATKISNPPIPQFSRLGSGVLLLCIQWNLSNPDTLGTEKSVLISEVSWFLGLDCTRTWHLGQQKVSCLSRCPHFRVSWLERYNVCLVWAGRSGCLLKYTRIYIYTTMSAPHQVLIQPTFLILLIVRQWDSRSLASFLPAQTQISVNHNRIAYLYTCVYL